MNVHFSAPSTHRWVGLCIFGFAQCWGEIGVAQASLGLWCRDSCPIFCSPIKLSSTAWIWLTLSVQLKDRSGEKEKVTSSFGWLKAPVRPQPSLQAGASSSSAPCYKPRGQHSTGLCRGISQAWTSGTCTPSHGYCTQFLPSTALASNRIILPPWLIGKL